MRVRWGPIAPLVIAVCLPMLELKATAGETVTVPDGEGTWKLEIAPSESAKGSLILLASQPEFDAEGAVPEPREPAAPADEYEEEPAIRPAVGVDPAGYWAVYRTIPFIRTEYEANPSYRHEATMEFMFGQVRPTVVHKHVKAGPVRPPAPRLVPPWVYDRYLGQIPTFVQRYFPPAIPFGYPLVY